MAASKSAKKSTKQNSKSKNTTTSRRKTSGSSSAKKRENTAAKRPSTGKKEAEAEPSRMELEVFLWVSLLVAILLCVGNFGFGGAVGDRICRFFFGCCLDPTGRMDPENLTDTG